VAPIVAAWPVGILQLVVTVLSLVLALVTAVLVVMNRKMPTWVLGLVVLLEVAVVALAVQCVVAWIGGTTPAQPVVFLAYLVVVLAAPVGTWLWAKGESSRWGPGVVCVAALVLPVLVVRLEQVWTTLSA
jgi:hypothetical protein